MMWDETLHWLCAGAALASVTIWLVEIAHVI